MIDAGSEEHRVPEKPAALPATEVLISRIGWLIRLRWTAVVGVLVFVEVARRVLIIQLFPSRLYTVLGILALYNLAVWLVFRRLRRAGTVDAGASSTGKAEEQVCGLARFLLPRIPAR